MGDIDALWAGGWTAGRSQPLKVWGPSGTRPEMGTKHEPLPRNEEEDEITRNSPR